MATTPALTGILYVKAKGARGLRDVETFGKQDPFLRLRSGGQVFKTKVHTDGGSNAVWGEEFRILLTTNLEREYLFLTVEDHNTLTASTEIGSAKIPLVDVPPYACDGTFEIFSESAMKVGLVELGLRLERFAPLGWGSSSCSNTSTPTNTQMDYSASTNTQTSMFPPMSPLYPQNHHSSPNGPVPIHAPQPMAMYTDDQVDVPGPLKFASTPSRPFTPVPPIDLLPNSPYSSSCGSSNYTAFSPYQQQRMQPTPVGDHNGNMMMYGDDEDIACNSLPQGWEERRTDDGRVFYLDHIHKTTTWERPVPAYSA